MTPEQKELLEGWLPGSDVVRDHSWGLVGTTVLEVLHDGNRYIVKAGDEDDTNLSREIIGHREWLSPWTSIGRAPRMIHSDEHAKLLVTEYQPGELVLGTDHEHLPETYRQAGQLLARFHEQLSVEEGTFEADGRERAMHWLDRPHRIGSDDERRLRAEIESWPTPPSTLVPTHGDWQPRNWLIHEGTVSVIDFGRAGLRPAWTDLARLAAQQFRGNPALEAAFLDGYGTDPREPEAWHRDRIRSAIGTVCWAHLVGADDFEAQGRRMIAEVLELL